MLKKMVLCVFVLLLGATSVPSYADDVALADDIATLFRSARAVISKNQKHINDASIGDKGLSAASVVASAKENFKKAAGKDVDEANPMIAAELKAVAFVMDEAQSLINEKGKNFKGFLPAVFAGQVASKFSSLLEGKASIKLTAPKKYVRNRKNRPDKWEHSSIEKQFSGMTATDNKPYSELTEVKGKKAFRFILPEFYKESCLGCHGDPKGELDITGGKKEGGKLGELGGAISVVIYK